MKVEKRREGGFPLGFIAVFSMILMVSCMKEFPEEFPVDYEWNAEIAMPLGESIISLEDNSYDSVLNILDTVSENPQWINEIEIPVNGSFEFVFRDILEQFEGINRVTLRINIYNGFPVDFPIQALLKTSRNYTIDTLFQSGYILNKAIVTDEGNTLSPSLTTKDVIFEGEELRNLEEIEEIAFSAVIPATRNFQEYTLRIQMGAIIRFKTNFPIL